MKRKQINLTETELEIITDALARAWWIRYDPKLEPNVEPHHNLYNRLVSIHASLIEANS